MKAVCKTVSAITRVLGQTIGFQAVIIPTQDKHQLIVGFAWHICETNKIIGYAKVIS